MAFNSHLNMDFGETPESAEALLAQPSVPLFSLADGLLHEGLFILGGQHLTGKSWLMLDLALSVATGGHVWRHFPVHEPQPVLYMALQDPRRRLQERLCAIQPDFRTTGVLQFLYRFPVFNEGGLEKLRGWVESGRYRLIVIDSLPRLVPYSRGYRKTVQALAELQDLCHRHAVCLVTLVPLVMAEMDPIFDAVPKSKGAPSVLWVLEARSRNPVRTLYTRDDEGIYRSLRLHFAGKHWQYLSPEDERQKASSQLRQDILGLFDGRDGAMHEDELSEVLSYSPDLYRKTLRSLATLLEEGEVVRLESGRYALATSHGEPG